MSKQRESKLDQHAATLLEMDDQHKTLAEIQAWLKEEGLVVSPATISRFLESARSRRSTEALLGQIASGAQQCQQIDKAFQKNPAPQLEMAIKVFKVLIMQLATKGTAAPDFLRLADQLMRTAIEFISGQTKAAFKERELTLAETKFHWNAAKEARKALPALRAIEANKSLSESEKTQMFMEKLFGPKPASPAAAT